VAQYDFTMTSGTGLQLLTNIASMQEALRTNHAGASRPSYVDANQLWVDTTTATLLLLKLWDGTQDHVLWKYNPSTGEGFAPGALIREVVGVTGSHSHHAMAATAEFEMLGGGGAGGGATTPTANDAAAGTGGNGGEFVRWRRPLGGVLTSTLAVGAAGAPATGAAGGAGGNTSVTHDGVTVTAKGGEGGLVGFNSVIHQGRAGPATSTSGQVDTEFRTGTLPGGPGWNFGKTIQSAAGAFSGAGGGEGGGQGRSTVTASADATAGRSAVGPGCGGGGAVIVSTATTRAGGVPTAGRIIIREYA